MPRDNLSPLAMRLRMLRKQHHMTQADVAKELNLHRTSYTNYETDGSRPDPATLRLLAEMFGVTVDYLLGNGDEDPIAVLQDNATVVALSPEEMELVSSFRRLTESQQQLILQNERALLDAAHKEE